jgi:mannose-6-phosphate isomerase-like protein (cupin superfamily)
MKVIYKNQTKIFKNSEVCTAIEYPMGDKDINGAVIELSGRYPDKGRTVNERCKEMAYVIKGLGKVVVEGKEVQLNEGDLVLIEPGEKFFWEGKMTLFMPCTPAWYPEQHKEVE